MSIREVMSMCIEPGLCEVKIYSSDKGEIIWTGVADDIPDEYGDLPFESFDVPQDGSLTINID